MAEKFIGCIVSIECKSDALGTYQGQVFKVDKSRQTVTIVKAFHNGKLCSAQHVTISALDIRDLHILKTAESAGELAEIRHHSTGQSSYASEAVTIRPGDGRAQYSSEAVTIRPGDGRAQGDSKQEKTHRVSRSYGGQGHISNTITTPTKDTAVIGNTNHFHSNMSRSQSFKEGRSRSQHRSTPTTNEDSTYRKRTNSASASENQSRKPKPATPKKGQHENETKHHRDDCFSTPIDDSYHNEFDFEKNLALFDKRAIFDEIDKSRNYNYFDTMAMDVEQKPNKYKCDENVLEGIPAQFKIINVPKRDLGSVTYFTDSGLVVPSISYELRCRLLSTAERLHFDRIRQLEMIGRSASEMALQLLGGSNRLNPQNAHQRPSVIILSADNFQGALGVNCSRLLANRNVKTTLLAPNAPLSMEMVMEVKLYDQTAGKRLNSVKDLPRTPVDLIINCLDVPDPAATKLKSIDQSWFTKAVQWTNQSKAPVLTIDPPPEGSLINTKWSLCYVLPLALSEACGTVYLCDLGLTKAVFNECQITYSSPFAHKFIIPLHNK